MGDIGRPYERASHAIEYRPAAATLCRDAGDAGEPPSVQKLQSLALLSTVDRVRTL